MKKKKGKTNYYKIGALILMLIELYIAFVVDKELVKSSLNAWRLYIVCIMFIPINFMFICTKQTRKVK